MGCRSHFNFLFLCFFLIISTSIAKKSSSSSHPHVKTLVFPVTKVHSDFGPDQYVTKIKKKTPKLPIKVSIDISHDIPFLYCDRSYLRYTYKPINCSSPLCSFAFYPYESCYSNNTCASYTYNNICDRYASGKLIQDIVTVKSIDGRSVSVPNFIFTCSIETFLFVGLPNGVKGVAGFGVSNISFTYEFAAVWPQKEVCHLLEPL